MVEFESPYFQLQEVTDGVYAALAVPGMGAWGNAGIVDLGDRTLVFDTFATPSAARDLRTAAEQLAGRRVSWVINSHNHLDHVFGNEVFTDAEVIATLRTHELITTRSAAFIEQAKAHPEFLESLQAALDAATDEARQRELAASLGEYRAISAALPTLRVRPPNLTFEGRIVFHGPQRTAELISYGGGHTESDAFLYLPNERIGFLGDLVQVGFHPTMSQGDPEVWDLILAQVAELNLETIVPGHGSVGTGWDLLRMRQYMMDLQQLTVAEPEPDADATAVPPMPALYATWEAPGVYVENMQFLRERHAASSAGSLAAPPPI